MYVNVLMNAFDIHTGTCALEIAEQVPDVHAVVIPVGGGGFIAGCAVALKGLHPNIQVSYFYVQSSKFYSTTFYLAFNFMRDSTTYLNGRCADFLSRDDLAHDYLPK